jgi:esterase/lipase
MSAQRLPAIAQEPEYDIDPAVYARSARVFRSVKKLLKIHFELHGDLGLIDQGQIFLFNHFARFETFIPQYLFYEARRVQCCSVASAEFFQEDNLLSAFLRDVGVVPNNHPRLMPWLAEQILRGRKVVIFPEGGMVKDRRVLDRKGGYSIYSRSSMDRRKHHTGAAVLALGLHLFRVAVEQAERRRDHTRLDAWAESLKLDDRAALSKAVRRPTLIVPGNITFFPLRIDENLLMKGAELFTGGLTQRFAEELRIEGNLLLRDTDMDICLGHPIDPADCWRFWEEWLTERMADRIHTLDDAFALTRKPHLWDESILAGGIRRCAKSVRNAYMREMYQAVTVNLSHIASTLVMQCLAKQRREIGRGHFHKALYLALKSLQFMPGVHLHHGLQDPEEYRSLFEENHPGVLEFLETARKSGLIEIQPDGYRFLPKLLKDSAFDEIRIENPVAVYANEVEPISAIARAVERALAEAEKLRPADLARLRFNEEVRSWHCDRDYYDRPELAKTNGRETLQAAAGPFFLKTADGRGEGVLLVHELLACPAEMRGLAERLAARGYTVLGVRLPGHGTSPHDLERCRWEDWLDSLRRNYAILRLLTQRVHLIGAGGGGLLALLLASERPEGLAGVAALSLPYKFGASANLAPLRRAPGILFRWLTRRGSKPFLEREPEHPKLAYRNVPMSAVYELGQLNHELDARLPEVHCPVFLAQADADPLLDPASTRLVYEALGSRDKAFRSLHADTHSLLLEDKGGIQGMIVEFLRREGASFPEEEPLLLTQPLTRLLTQQKPA